MSIESVMLANHLTLYHPLYIIREWNAKRGSQEIPGKTGKFSLEVQHESGQRLTKFFQENLWVIVNTLFQQPKKWLYTWTPPDGQYRSLIMFLEAKVEKFYTVSEKQDMELAMAQIMSYLLQNPGLYWRKWGKPLGHSGMSSIKSLWLHNRGIQGARSGSLIQFTPIVKSDSLWSNGLQHARFLCPSPTFRACSNSCPLSQWCHPTISSSVIHLPSCLQPFLTLGYSLRSQVFTSGGQSNGATASASVLPMNTQDWFPLQLTG